jgi:hypothetical protein
MILMVDFTSTQAQAKELAPPASRGVAQSEAAVTKHWSASPPLSANGVDRMYHKLPEIQAITAAQLAECAPWRRTGTFEEPRDITTQHTTNYKAVMHHPTQTSREATPSSGKEAPSDIATYYALDGNKGSNKRRKQCPLGTATNTSRCKDRGCVAGGSSLGQVLTTAHVTRRLVWPPTDHYKRLPEEACPNYAYPIKHKLKDCGMM